MNKEWIDHEIEEVLGIDTEVEDRSVGLFGNEFILCLKDKNSQHHSLSFFDDEFYSLLTLLMPYFKQIESKMEIEQDLDFESYLDFLSRTEHQVRLKKLKGGRK